ncbi:serine/threonine-protein kinase (plasmid) [Radiobacillus kanasensis]|uniref:serine/threonine-protein kinase n=1 Tax=Radiobacillus kanasensis TaxID=2844358 RepID=UPI001E329828|nr:serine/threonine-protein kinase [Radiobacillus kanasensis]UFU01488.1 serine/threonine-protein kinase [Radiobacillus kanasensis]
MNQASKKQGINLRPGKVIVGKWHQHQYVIKKRLGHGAIGSVFLCERNGRDAALKISEKSSSITMEVNVLKTFEKVQGNRLGPSLLDVDDWVTPSGKQLSFYVMEYLKGEQLPSFFQSHGEEWLAIFVLQLLDDLTELHQAGWVFGDLKTENLIITSPPPRLRWIDVGGTTQIGRSIKEYTEFYDRGYWNLGSRKAEPSYDLFALAMVMVRIFYPKGFERGKNPERTLMGYIQQSSGLKKYEPILKKAFYGKYATSEAMKKDLSTLLLKYSDQTKKRKSQPQARSQAQTKVRAKPTRSSYKAPAPKRKSFVVVESFAISFVVFLFYMFYLFLT